MVAITVPSGAVEYQQQANIFESRMLENPVTLSKGAEQASGIPLNFSWGIDSGGGTTIHVNVSSLSQQPFSNIRGMFVNNTACDVDLVLIFQDVTFPVRIPANSSGFYPVFTNRTDFYVVATGALSGDVSYIEVFNHPVAPAFYPKTDFTSVVSSATVGLVTGNTQLIPSGVNGVLTQVQLMLTGVVAGASNCVATMLLEDNLAPINTFFNSSVQIPAGTFVYPLLIFNSMREQRFRNGLILSIAQGGANPTLGGITATVNYRT